VFSWVLTGVLWFCALPDIDECSELGRSICGAWQCENMDGSYRCVVDCPPGHNHGPEGICMGESPHPILCFKIPMHSYSTHVSHLTLLHPSIHQNSPYPLTHQHTFPYHSPSIYIHFCSGLSTAFWWTVSSTKSHLGLTFVHVHYINKSMWKYLYICGFDYFSHTICWQVYKVEHTAVQSS
jgi:hypothetical protein